MRSFLFASAAVLLASNAVAQTQAPNPNCQRLEAQLANVDRGTADPARADQIRRAEDALNRQQFELDKNVAQARRMGCQNSGFFSIFTITPPQCGGLNQQIDQQRAAIESHADSLEQLNGGTTERAEARRSLLIALADNGCGPQYRQAALAGQQGGFFDRLFGTNSGPFAPSGPIGNTFRTVCVRSCDGYYFPISFSTTQDHFRDDEATCQRMCPAAEVHTLHLPQSRRGRVAGGLAQRPALHRIADRIPISKSAERQPAVAAAPAKAGPTRSGPTVRTIRLHQATCRHRAKREAAVAAARRRRRQTGQAGREACGRK